MLKYCFANDCPYDELELFRIAASSGTLYCLRFLFDEVKPSRETEKTLTASVRYHKRHECLHYLREKGCVEPTDEEYAYSVEQMEDAISSQQ